MGDTGRPGSGPIRFKTTFTNTIYEAMKRRGWRETNSDSDWDFIWAERWVVFFAVLARSFRPSVDLAVDTLHCRVVLGHSSPSTNRVKFPVFVLANREMAHSVDG